MVIKLIERNAVQVIGPPQLAWLQAGLAEHTAKVASSVNKMQKVIKANKADK